MFAGWAPPTGEISYNGIVFDGASKVTIDVSPVYDTSGRVVLYSRHVFSISSKVTASADLNTDSSLDLIRLALQKPGRRFSFSQRGFGTFVVNGYGGIQDLEFGPKPKVLRWVPLGDTNACDVTWQVEVCVPRCSVFPLRGPLELSWTIDWNYAQDGTCTRTCSGTLRVISYHQNSAVVSDSADNYRHLLFVYPIPGFARTQSYNLSNDRQKLTFTCTDVEIASNLAYPYGVSKASGNHSVNYQLGGITSHTLSMSLEMIRGFDSRLMWNIFQSFTQKYLDHHRNKTNSVPLLRSLAIAEDIWGLGSNFSLDWETTNTLRYLIEQSGLWRLKYDVMTPFMRNDWSYWAASVAHGPYAVRSYTGLGYSSGDFAIDLCEMSNSHGVSGGVSVGGTSPPSGVVSSGSGDVSSGGISAPTPEKSWIEWNVHVMPVVSHNVSHVGLGGEMILSPDSTWRSNDAIPFAMRAATKTPKAAIGYHGASRHEVTIYGRIKRMTYAIGRPRLVLFAGLPVFEKNAVYDLWTEPSSFGQPVNCMSFLVTYGVLSAGTNAGPIPNFLTEQEDRA